MQRVGASETVARHELRYFYSLTNMDEQTTWMLALQLVALISIASAILLYLMCKIRGNSSPAFAGSGHGANKAVLVTCCDNAIGLQIAIHLANRGFRVFAGIKPRAETDSVSEQILRAWQKHRETVPKHGNIIALPLDVTREDLLYESVDIIRAHLPAGEDGIWAVICTNGITYRNPLIQQNIDHWDSLLRINVIGVLRTARTFQNLLKNSSGRILMIGTTDNLGTGLVAYTASRYAVEGASYALKHELSPFGIKVVTLNPIGILPELLFCQPKIAKKTDGDKFYVEINGGVDFHPNVLSAGALDVMYRALTVREPKGSYKLEYKYNKWTHPIQICKYHN